MPLSQDDFRRLREQLKRHEGAKKDAQGQHAAYRCPAGKLTIGYGHNLEANPLPGNPQSISEAEALILLDADITAAAARLCSTFPWARGLEGPRLAVLINMVFNLGLRGLGEFQRMLAQVKEGEYRPAAREMLYNEHQPTAWAVQVGPRARELARMMESGTW